jgi:hypothetical protein
MSRNWQRHNRPDGAYPNSAALHWEASSARSEWKIADEGARVRSPAGLSCRNRRLPGGQDGVAEGWRTVLSEPRPPYRTIISTPAGPAPLPSTLTRTTTVSLTASTPSLAVKRIR